MSRQLAEWISGIILILSGGMIYVLFRPRNLAFFAIADCMGLGCSVDKWRNAATPCRLSDFALYSLPCGLWTTSYLFIIDSLFLRHPISTRLLWASVIPIMGVASEFMQAIGFLPGTFDYADLLCYIFPLVFYINFIKSEKHEN